MSDNASNLRAFYADATHANLYSVERMWLDTMVDQAMHEMNALVHLVTIARSVDRTYAIGAFKDERTGEVTSYAHWMICPVAGKVKIGDCKVFLHQGYYDIPSLTEAVSTLNTRTGRTI